MAEHTIKETLSTVSEYIGEEIKDKLNTKEAKFRVSTLPTASFENVGETYQYIGTTTSSLTKNYFYECKAQGTDPETYDWEEIGTQDVSDKEEKFRFVSMPTASEDWLGKIVEYIGDSGSGLVKGKRYECVEVAGSDPTEYRWQELTGDTKDGRIEDDILKVGIRQEGAKLIAYVKMTYEIPSLSDLTIDEILEYVNGYYSGNISLEDIQDAWKLGQYFTVNLSAMPSYSGEKSLSDSGHVAQIVQPMLVAINHYNISEDENDTKALLTFYTKDCLLEKGPMDGWTGGHDDISGWKAQPRRDWCNTVIYNSLPQTLKDNVKEVVRNVQATSYTARENVVDKIFMPEAVEVGGNSGGGTKYPYFDSSAKRIKNVNGTASNYWLANDHSVAGGYHMHNEVVKTSGDFAIENSECVRSNSYGLAFGFCI